MKSIAYLGYYGTTEVEVIIPNNKEHQILGIAQINCFECDGTGDWPFGPTEAECGPCISCKGTGKIYINA